jgi:hypothetical protein
MSLDIIGRRAARSQSREEILEPTGLSKETLWLQLLVPQWRDSRYARQRTARIDLHAGWSSLKLKALSAEWRCD